LKNLKHIFLFIFLAFFGRSLAVPVKISVTASYSGDLAFIKSKANYVTPVLQVTAAKINRQKRPKKPKGIKVIVLNLANHTFYKLCHFSDYSVHEVKGDYSLLLHYSHGMRGPPSGLI
jgi:hypothetical protein